MITHTVELAGITGHLIEIEAHVGGGLLAPIWQPGSLRQRPDFFSLAVLEPQIVTWIFSYYGV
jgi:hypothetical protein